MSVVLEKGLTTDELLGGGHAPLPRVNLLPPEIAQRRRFRQVQYGLGGSVLVSIGVMALLYAGAAGSVRDAEAELRDVRAEGAATQAEQAKYAEAAAVHARADAAQVMLTQAMGEEVRYATLLNQLSTSVPDEVWLKDITFTQTPPSVTAGDTTPAIGTVTFTGTAFDHDDVATWLESLAAQKGYAKPYLTSTTEALIGKEVTADFVTTVVITSDALSRRYAQATGS